MEAVRVFYAVFVARAKQAMDLPHRAEMDPDYGLVADGLGPRIEDAVRMALRKDTGLSQLAVFQGDYMGELPNGCVVFKPTDFVWCLPRDEAREEVAEVYAADEPEPEEYEEPVYQEPVRRTRRQPKSPKKYPRPEPVSGKRKRARAGRYAIALGVVATIAIGAAVVFQNDRLSTEAQPAQSPNSSSGPTAMNVPTASSKLQTQQNTQFPASVQVIPQQPTPAAPAVLVVVSTGPAVKLSWVGAAGANKYLVYRSTSPSFSTAQEAGSTLQTEWTDPNVQPGKTYYYWVASNSSGGSTFDPHYVKATAAYSFEQLHQMDANDIVRIKTYTTVFGVFGSNDQGTGWFLSNGRSYVLSRSQKRELCD